MNEKEFEQLWMNLRSKKPMPHQYLHRIENHGRTQVIVDLTTRTIYRREFGFDKNTITTTKMKNRG